MSCLDYSSYFHFCLSSSLSLSFSLLLLLLLPLLRSIFFFLIKFNELAVDSPGQVCAADKVTLHKRNFVNEPRAEQWDEGGAVSLLENSRLGKKCSGMRYRNMADDPTIASSVA